MARGTRVDATRHARLRGRPAQGPGSADTWRGPRESTRTPEWRHVAVGGWHLEGPQVSGPWLGVWGGNAIAFSRPTFYTRDSLPFLPCGTMFPWKFSFAGHVAEP